MVLAEWQLPDAKGMHTLGAGDSGPRPVDPVLLPGLRVAGDRAGRNIEAAAEGAIIADVLRVGIVDIKRQPVGHTLYHRDLQRVVAEVTYVRAPDVADAAVLRKRNQSLRNRKCGSGWLRQRRILEERGDVDARHYGLRLGHICRSRRSVQERDCRRCQSRPTCGYTDGRTQPEQILGIQLVNPVAARAAIAAVGGIDEEMALVADVVDGDRHVSSDPTLQTEVVEVELRRAARDIRIGKRDAARCDYAACTVEIVTRIQQLGRWTGCGRAWIGKGWAEELRVRKSEGGEGCAAVQVERGSSRGAGRCLRRSGRGYVEAGLPGSVECASAAANTAGFGEDLAESNADHRLVVDGIGEADARPPVLPVCADRRSAPAAYSGATIAPSELEHARRAGGRFVKGWIEERPVIFDFPVRREVVPANTEIERQLVVDFPTVLYVGGYRTVPATFFANRLQPDGRRSADRA